MGRTFAPMSSPLRIVFIGTPHFAVPSLAILLENGYDIAAVITAPDKPAGRGLQLQQSPIKEFALSKGLPVLQPTNLKDLAFQDELRSYNANLQIVIAFRMLPVAVWDMPELGTFNLHASLLPQYRGAAPINWAIINGEKETGLTTFFLRHEIDTGDILFREKIAIGYEETASELHDRMSTIGASLVLKTVKAIEADDYSPVPQPAASDELKKAPKIFKEHCRIDWTKPAHDIYNLIRGLSPYPAAFTTLDGKILKIFTSLMADERSDLPPGSIYTDGKSYLRVSAGDFFIYLTEIQLEGKKKMGIAEFLRGYRIQPGTILI
jgi:methionyl-tRNA formyltransferase